MPNEVLNQVYFWQHIEGNFIEFFSFSELPTTAVQCKPSDLLVKNK